MNTMTMVRICAFFVNFSVLALNGCVKTSEKTIAIIGGGISGLTCGKELLKAGFDNIYLCEARGRLGGRVLTVKINDTDTELGGTSLGDGGTFPYMRQLIEESNLTIKSYVKKRDAQWKCTKYFDGTDIIFTKERLKECNFDLETLDERLEQLAEKYDSIQEILKEIFPDDNILYEVFAAKIADYEGAAVDKLSSYCVDTLRYHLRGALNSAYGNENDEVAPIESIEGGNALLIERLAEKLDGKIHLNMPLEKISKKMGVYELTFTTGETRTADIVILTIPCSVYKDITFDENVLSFERVNAISSVLYGTNSKIILPAISTKKGFSSYTDGRTTLSLDDNNHVMVYYIGNNGIFSPETIESHLKKERTFIESSYHIDPDLPQPICARDKQFVNYDGPVGHSWPNDPYAKGSYSCVGVGQEEAFLATEDYANEKVKTLFKPVDDTLFFAGEHSCIPSDDNDFDIGGTMEAAAESGYRTARIINNMYGEK